MSVWAWLVWALVILAFFGAIVWLVNLGRKMASYVTQAGDAARTLQAAARRAETEFPESDTASAHDNTGTVLGCQPHETPPDSPSVSPPT